MTASATLVRADPVPQRAAELVLAHAHLRLGSLALARVELETMAGLAMLDGTGFVDLAEARWRTGDLTGAGEAAHAALRTETDDPIALVIASEAAAALGRPSEARRLSQRAMACATGSIDAIFAGMPRSSVWPPDGDEPPPAAPTLFDRGPETAAPPEGASVAPERPATAPAAAAPAPTGPVEMGFWDADETPDPGPTDLPDPALELEAGRAALVAGSLDQAALRFGIALRLAPSLALAVLEATAGARGPALAMVRGDAYRLAGHESDAREAYAVAAQGGAPERRQRVRPKHPKAKAAATGEVEAETPDAVVDVDGDTDDDAGLAVKADVEVAIGAEAADAEELAEDSEKVAEDSEVAEEADPTPESTVTDETEA
jgi:hypothetical protein